MVIALDDSVRDWNEAATVLYEIPAEHAIGRQFRDLDISYRAEGLRARIEDVKRAVVSVRLENVMFGRRSGGNVHVDFWIARVFDERSRSAAILVAAIDNTAVARFREEIVRRGFTIIEGTHAIVPVMLGEAAVAQDMSNELLKEGVYVKGLWYPVVPKGEARLRAQISAAHSREDLDRALEAFSIVGKRLGVIS